MAVELSNVDFTTFKIILLLGFLALAIAIVHTLSLKRGIRP